MSALEFLEKKLAELRELHRVESEKPREHGNLYIYAIQGQISGIELSLEAIKVLGAK